MILGFTTKIKNKPTHFVEKIIIGLVKSNIITIDYASELLQMPMSKINSSKLKPKLTTFREDKNDRWKTGNKIDFFINVRTKKMFRFAPVLPVVSTQKVLIAYEKDFYTEETRPTVWIDHLVFYDPIKRCDFGMLQLAQNDGFDSVEDLFAYFSEDFTGKIIHWTDLRY